MPKTVNVIFIQYTKDPNRKGTHYLLLRIIRIVIIMSIAMMIWRMFCFILSMKVYTYLLPIGGFCCVIKWVYSIINWYHRNMPKYYYCNIWTHRFVIHPYPIILGFSLKPNEIAYHPNWQQQHHQHCTDYKQNNNNTKWMNNENLFETVIGYFHSWNLVWELILNLQHNLSFRTYP